MGTKGGGQRSEGLRFESGRRPGLEGFLPTGRQCRIGSFTNAQTARAKILSCGFQSRIPPSTFSTGRICAPGPPSDTLGRLAGRPGWGRNMWPEISTQMRLDSARRSLHPRFSIEAHASPATAQLTAHQVPVVPKPLDLGESAKPPGRVSNAGHNWGRLRCAGVKSNSWRQASSGNRSGDLQPHGGLMLKRTGFERLPHSGATAAYEHWSFSISFLTGTRRILLTQSR